MHIRAPPARSAAAHLDAELRARRICLTVMVEYNSDGAALLVDQTLGGDRLRGRGRGRGLGARMCGEHALWPICVVSPFVCAARSSHTLRALHTHALHDALRMRCTACTLARTFLPVANTSSSSTLLSSKAETSSRIHASHCWLIGAATASSSDWWSAGWLPKRSSSSSSDAPPSDRPRRHCANWSGVRHARSLVRS